MSLAAWGASRPCAADGGAMGQGEASIAVRSDVKLSVKGTGGTPSERLSKLGQSVSDELGEIRTCYRKLVANSPEITGTLRLRLGLEKDQRPALSVLNQGGAAEPLVQCVTQVLTRAKYADVARPAAAFLTLEFDNSRARGQSQMLEKSAELAHVEVHTNPAGLREASWATMAQEVRFTVEAESAAPPAAVELVLQGFTRGYAAFLDCRRKCEQGGASPEGDIHARVAVDAKGHAKFTLGEVTVAHKRAPGCAERAFQRVPFDKPDAPLQANVRVHFAP